VAVDALQVGVDGRLGEGQWDVLQGLGHVTVDRGAAAAIEQVLQGWALVEPVALDGTGAHAPLPVIAIPSAFLAVQEAGQRSDFLMDVLEARETAENRAQYWQRTVHLVAELIPGWGGAVAGVVEGYLAIALNMDGTWDNGTDRGLLFDRDDAAAAAVAALAPQEPDDVRAVREQATAAFDRTAGLLGERRPPQSPAVDLAAPWEDLGIDARDARMGNENGRTGGRVRRPR
jgi:hypothetical protein